MCKSAPQFLTIGEFRNVFKFHAYSVNERLFLTTAKLVRGLSDVATTNVCKVDTSNKNHIERSRWMKWWITGLRQKKYPLIWIHYESPLLVIQLYAFFIMCRFHYRKDIYCIWCRCHALHVNLNSQNYIKFSARIRNSNTHTWFWITEWL